MSNDRTTTTTRSSTRTIFNERNGIIGGMPQEILSLVLETYIKSVESEELCIRPLFESQRETSTNMAGLRVCRLWRTLLTSKSTIWTTIETRIGLLDKRPNYDLTTPSTTQLVRLKSRISWANGQPIELYISPAGEYPGDYIYYPKLFIEHDGEIIKILEETKPLFRSFYDLHFGYTLGHIFFNHILTPGRSKHLTYLCVTQLDVYLLMHRREESHSDTNFSFPNLRGLSLSCHESDAVRRFLAKLESPALQSLALLSEYNVSLSDSAAPSLHRFPLLQELHLDLGNQGPIKHIARDASAVATSIRRLVFDAVDDCVLDYAKSSFKTIEMICPSVEDPILTSTYKLRKLPRSHDPLFLNRLKRLHIVHGPPASSPFEPVRRQESDLDNWRRTFKGMSSLQNITLGFEMATGSPVRWMDRKSSPDYITDWEVNALLGILTEVAANEAPRFFSNLKHIQIYRLKISLATLLML